MLLHSGLEIDLNITKYEKSMNSTSKNEEQPLNVSPQFSSINMLSTSTLNHHIQSKICSTFDRKYYTRFIRKSPQDFLNYIFETKQQVQVRRLIDQIISRSSLKTSYLFSQNFPYSRQYPKIIKEKEDSQRIFYFINGSQEIDVSPLFIRVDDTTHLKDKYRIFIQSNIGEILLFAEEERVSQLSQQIITFVKKLRDFVVIEYTGVKPFKQFKWVTKLLETGIHFVWIQKHDVQNYESLLLLQDNKQKKTFYAIQKQGLDIITSFEVKQQKLITKAIEKATCLHGKMQSVKQSIQYQCPELKTSYYYFYLLSLIQNLLVMGKNIIIQKGQIYIYPILKFIVSTLQNKFKIQQSPQSISSMHFPFMIEYPKYCNVCKIDNKLALKQKEGKNTKKTKYACIGCSHFFNSQVRLCVLCFKKFHESIQYYMCKGSNKNQKSTQMNLPPPFDKKFSSHSVPQQQSQFILPENNTFPIHQKSSKQYLLVAQKLLELMSEPNHH